MRERLGMDAALYWKAPCGSRAHGGAAGVRNEHGDRSTAKRWVLFSLSLLRGCKRENALGAIMASQRRIAANRRNWSKRRGLTESGRQRLREAAFRNQPWRRNTGPKTQAGKVRARMNARKSGRHDAIHRATLARAWAAGRFGKAIDCSGNPARIPASPVSEDDQVGQLVVWSGGRPGHVGTRCGVFFLDRDLTI